MRWYEVTLGIQGFVKEIDGFAQPKSKVELLLNKHETCAVRSPSSHRQIAIVLLYSSASRSCPHSSAAGRKGPCPYPVTLT